MRESVVNAVWKLSRSVLKAVQSIMTKSTQIGSRSEGKHFNHA